MLVVSENLLGITRSLGICNCDLVEEFSLRVRLDRKVRYLRDLPELGKPVLYESPIDASQIFCDLEEVAEAVVLDPGKSALACSMDEYRMPRGYFGLLQTKGSLGRLFVSATANDGQVEPGYCGKLTLELTNHASFSVALRPGAVVAQMFVFRCSSEATNPYAGRYQGAQEPTIPIFR